MKIALRDAMATTFGQGKNQPRVQSFPIVPIMGGQKAKTPKKVTKAKKVYG